MLELDFLHEASNIESATKTMKLRRAFISPFKIGKKTLTRRGKTNSMIGLD